MSLYITGIGLTTKTIPHIMNLQEIAIERHPTFPIEENIEKYLDKQITFNAIQHISREDRASLNDVTKLAIDASQQAFAIAERQQKFSLDDKQCFPIYLGTEAVDYRLTALKKLLAENDQDIDLSLQNLGQVKNHLHPLDMFRLLSTNTIYHLSKLFQLNGGGYPLRRMSLSGLCALEMAFYDLNKNKSRALVSAVGDLTLPENLSAFAKMGLIKTSSQTNGIIPSYGAASLIVENDHSATLQNHTRFAEVIQVHSLYKNDTAVTRADWSTLFATLDLASILQPLNIVLYANGVDALQIPEIETVNHFFPHARLFSYKPYTGYTGKANNLIDLIIALTDQRIGCDEHVLINGIGTSVGLGYMLIKKCCQP